MGSTELVFQHTALKDARFQFHESGLLVQAIKGLGPTSLNSEAMKRMRAWLKPALRSRVRKDTQIVTGWVHDVIRQVTEDPTRG